MRLDTDALVVVNGDGMVASVVVEPHRFRIAVGGHFCAFLRACLALSP